MRYQSGFTLLALSITAGLYLPAVSAAPDQGFVEGTSAALQARNYYFSRDFSGQTRSEEWAQGFILDVKSGYTTGPVGFGIDMLGQLGIKLDSGGGRVNTGLLPTDSDGKAVDNYSRLGVALKARWSQTELKVGEQTPNLPVLTFSDIRLLPPTYQGVSVVSREVEGL